VPGAEPPAAGVICEPIYPAEGGYSPGLAQNARVFVRGLRPGGVAIYHYFFAPNPITSVAGRLQRLAARIKTVQTVCSAPASFAHIRRMLFTDRVVVLSRSTEQQMIAAGVEPDRLRLIRPGIEPLSRLDPARREVVRNLHGVGSEPLIVFPGDYEFSTAATTVARAAPLIVAEQSAATLLFACRIKSEASREIRQRLESDIGAAGIADRVRFLDTVADMPSLMGAADLVVMPAESLYAKMDAPLVLLEAMSQGVPLVLADVPPLDEIVALGAALGVTPGSPSELAAAALRILAEPNLSRSLGERGERAVGEQFSAKGMARRVESVYEELLGAGRS
jgi:glycosyltransferase involved in cell wall biosynthesis